MLLKCLTTSSLSRRPLQRQLVLGITALLLAGLLAGEQEAAVKRAMHRAGFRMAARLQRGDWAILWLRRRRAR